MGCRGRIPPLRRSRRPPDRGPLRRHSARASPRLLQQGPRKSPPSPKCVTAGDRHPSCVPTPTALKSSSPRLRGTSYLGNPVPDGQQPQGGCIPRALACHDRPIHAPDGTLSGFSPLFAQTQGRRSCVAPTLGWMMERRWRLGGTRILIPKWLCPPSSARPRTRHARRNAPQQRTGIRPLRGTADRIEYPVWPFQSKILLPQRQRR